MPTTLWTVVASGAIMILGWMFGIEPRLRVMDQKHIALKELIDSKLDDMKDRLERIENLILNGRD